MFGKNPIRKQDLKHPNQIRVQELFPTIQGEGPYQGMPCVFLRLWGCNLKCFWCDTDFESGTWWPDNEMIVKHIELAMREQCAEGLPTRRLVVITGGEPFRQDIRPLLKLFAAKGWMTQIETNGTLWLEGIETFIKSGDLTLVCSPKTPKIHEKFHMWCYHWKYIIDSKTCSSDDGLPMASTQVEGKMAKIARHQRGEADIIWVQPMDMDHVHSSITQANTRYACEVAMRHGYRLCIQQHKVVGLP